ncbi:hypothetical protein G9A89_016376 [Geosiphon pyriformis]|nr:hypothetical protein G9A89_016376 [Geosiphon pyriformis]
MAFAKIQEASLEEIKEVKNNPSEPLELDWDEKPVINLLEPEKFHEHYQTLASTREEQEQCLAQINTKLCDYCLILCDFQYCNECNLIYNPLPYMIYTIPEKKKPINNCTSESKSIFNPNSNSDNDNKNNGSSSVQYGNEISSDSNSNSNYEHYIALPDLFKKQELKWYSDNDKSIILKRAHDTDAEGINIRGGIIDAEYVENIVAMLQNDSEKAYIIKPNEKIAQAIFLPLVKIAQLVSVKKRKELEITARGIQKFRSTDRIDVPVNMAEEEIIGQEEIISTGQAISISPYNQYMLAIERKKKDQAQIFEAKASLCKLGEVGLINLYIPAKNYSHIKIFIYNNTGNIIEIPARIIIGYLNTEMENQLSNPILDFPQLCEYVDITSQIIYG